MKKGETTRNAPCGTSQVDVAKPPGIGSGKNQILGSMGLCPQRASSSGLLASGGERAQAFQAVLMSTSEWPCGAALAGRKPRVAGPEALTGPATDAINRPAASAIASLRMTGTLCLAGRSRQWLGAVPAARVWAARPALRVSHILPPRGMAPGRPY